MGLELTQSLHDVALYIITTVPRSSDTNHVQGGAETQLGKFIVELPSVIVFSWSTISFTLN